MEASKENASRSVSRDTISASSFRSFKDPLYLVEDTEAKKIDSPRVSDPGELRPRRAGQPAV